MDKGYKVVGSVPPQSITGAAASSGWVLADAGYRLGAIVNVGAIAATVDWKLEQASSAAGAGAKDLYVGTQFAATDDNTSKQADFDASLLDTENGFFWYRLTITAGAAACLVAGSLVASDLRVAP